MSDERFAKLIDKLDEKTNEGKIIWEEGVGENVFQTSFSDYSVSISLVERRISSDNVLINIYNDSGRVIDNFTDEDLREFVPSFVSGSYYEVMIGLYGKARKQALGVDRALDDILNLLSE